MTNEPVQPEKRRTPSPRTRRAAEPALQLEAPADSAPFEQAERPPAQEGLPRRLFSSPATSLATVVPASAPQDVSAARFNSGAGKDLVQPSPATTPARTRSRRSPASRTGEAATALVGDTADTPLAAPLATTTTTTDASAAPTPEEARRRTRGARGRGRGAGEPASPTEQPAGEDAEARVPDTTPAVEPAFEIAARGAERAVEPAAAFTTAPLKRPRDEISWQVAPASAADLAAIARVAAGASLPGEPVWPLEDEEMVTWQPTAEDGAAGIGDPVVEAEEDAIDGAQAPRRRRRRGRGRRGGAGRNGQAEPGGDNASAVEATLPDGDVATAHAAALAAPAPTTQPPRPRPERQPLLPAYAVEFEPLPPPTKRKPSRRPGTGAEPRFSREEIKEFEQFVRPGQSVTPLAAAVPSDDELRAALLTAEEEAELRAAAPARRRAPRGRGRGDVAASEPESLQATPAFAPLAPAPQRAEGSPIEALLARQNFILDTLMERQIALLRNIEHSLLALDKRLAGGGAGGATRERAGVFVDVPNVIYAAERTGYTIDFKKLLHFLVTAKGRELVRASAYAPVSDDPQARLETQKFVQPFVNRGYRIVTKPLKRFSDGTMKGNFDVELAMDVLMMADRLDVVCLVSGDGDFRRLVEMVASKGVRVEAIAFSASTSSELKASCDEYIDLGLHLREISV